MSLIDPKNPARWCDDSPRSLNNGFVGGYSGITVRWTALETHARQRRASSRRVEKLRATGKDPAVVRGLSRKADELIRQSKGMVA